MALNLAGLRVLDGQRDGVSRIYHNDRGLYYHVNGTNADNSVVYFRCIKYTTRRCFGRGIWTEVGGFHESTLHNHVPDPLFSQVRVLVKRILDRCRRGHYASLRHIFMEERRRFPRAVQVKVTLARLRTAMIRARQSIYPQIPQNVRELGDVLRHPRTAVISLTEDGEDNIFAASVVCNDGSSAVIFASTRILRFMHRVGHVFADGTFCTPALPNISQVFNLVTTWRWHIIPLITVVMERRTTELYRAVLQEIKRMSPRFSPHTIMTDFESAQLRAWHLEFPRATHVGCLFHFMADLIKNAKDNHLGAMLRNVAAVAHIVRLCCVIPLVPQLRMRQAHRCIARMAQATLYYNQLRPFLNYVWDTWLVSHRYENLSVFRCLDRTNNASESFNRMLREEIGTAHHPNIWHFVQCLIHIEDNAITDIGVLFDGNNPSRTRKVSSIMNDATVLRWSDDLETGAITLEEFLRCVSYSVQSAFDVLVL